jgi:NitT/TauT family transport system permease protein
MAIAIVILFVAFPIGLMMGVFPIFEAALLRFVTVLASIPAVAILPVLFVIFGVGEVCKIALIVIGVMPALIRAAYLEAKAVPEEQYDLALSRGASAAEVAWRVVFPQIFPKLLNSFRLSLLTIFVLLLTSESIAATSGLGYRIFVLTRTMSNDVILPYVVWITLLLFVLDRAFCAWVKTFKWVAEKE